MAIEDLFFQLLQVAIGTRKMLDRQPTSQEWAALFKISNKHALTAIAFAGINCLKKVPVSGNGFCGSIGLDEMTYLKWLGMTAKVAHRNKVVSVACMELVAGYSRDGINCCIVKGQGNLVNYPEKLRLYRTLGDIDVWCAPMDPDGIEIAVSDLDGNGAHYRKYKGQQGVIEYALMLHRAQGTSPKEGVRYHHIDAPQKNGVEVEVHFRPLFLHSFIRNYHLQRWFKENEQFGLCSGKIDNVVLPIPTNSFNAVYQLAHMYRHLFDEGIGLRQLLDYYFVLRALHIEQVSFADRTQTLSQWAEGRVLAVKSNEEIMHALFNFGMKKFASAVMYVLQVVFAMPDEFLICKTNEKEGKFLLNEIMMAGNFGKYDERIKRPSKSSLKDNFLSLQMRHSWEKTKHNLRLLNHYPEEVLFEPFFRFYHWIWRRFEFWRF